MLKKMTFLKAKASEELSRTTSARTLICLVLSLQFVLSGCELPSASSSKVKKSSRDTASSTLNNSLGNNSNSSDAGPQAPDSPSGLSVGSNPSIPSARALYLQWNTTNRAESGYEVYRKNPGVNEFVLLTSSPILKTEYLDESVQYDFNYTYRVVARGAAPSKKSSAPSQSVTGSVSDAGPNTPTGFQVKQVGDKSVTLAWSLVAGAEKYEIEQRLGSTGGFTALASQPVSSPFTVSSGLENNQLYTFRLRAKSSSGKFSGYSNEAPGTPQAPVPGAPINLTSSGTLPNLTLKWDPVVGSASYQLERKLASESTYTVVASKIVATTTAHSLPSYGSYLFQVRAINSSGVLSAASVPHPVTYVETAPLQPVGLKATPGDKSVVLSWTAVAGLKYEIERKVDAGNFAIKHSNYEYTKAFEDSPLENGKVYTYQIRAKTALGTLSIYSATSSARPEIPLPGVPGGFSVKTPAEDKKVSLSWTKASGATSYDLERKKAGDSAFLLLPVTLGESALAHVDLAVENGTDYTYQLRARNAAGVSAYVGPLTIKPVATSPPVSATPALHPVIKADLALPLGLPLVLTTQGLKPPITYTTDRGYKKVDQSAQTTVNFSLSDLHPNGSIRVTATDVLGKAVSQTYRFNPRTLQSQFVQLSSYNYMTCALTISGQIYCWGKVSPPFGWDIKLLPAIVTPTKVEAPVGVVEISLGTSRLCARTFAGDLYCKSFASGRMKEGWDLIKGLPPVAQVSVGLEYTCVISKTREVYCGEDTTSSLSLTKVDQLSDIQNVSVTNGQACAVTATGDGFCWGRMAAGYTAVPIRVRNIPPAKQIIVTGNYSYALTLEKKLYRWCTYNWNTTCSLPTEHPWLNSLGSDTSRLLAVDGSVCLMKRSGELNCDVDGRHSWLKKIKDAALGGEHNCALTVDNKLSCWEKNIYGPSASFEVPVYQGVTNLWETGFELSNGYVFDFAGKRHDSRKSFVAAYIGKVADAIPLDFIGATFSREAFIRFICIWNSRSERVCTEGEAPRTDIKNIVSMASVDRFIYLWNESGELFYRQNWCPGSGCDPADLEFRKVVTSSEVASVATWTYQYGYDGGHSVTAAYAVLKNGKLQALSGSQAGAIKSDQLFLGYSLSTLDGPNGSRQDRHCGWNKFGKVFCEKAGLHVEVPQLEDVEKVVATPGLLYALRKSGDLHRIDQYENKTLLGRGFLDIRNVMIPGKDRQSKDVQFARVAGLTEAGELYGEWQLPGYFAHATAPRRLSPIRTEAGGALACLSVAAPSEGTRVVMQSCNDEINQRFAFWPVNSKQPDGVSLIQEQSSGLCLDAGASGDRLQLVACHPENSNQRFVLDGQLIKLEANGKCLDVLGANPADGAEIAQFQCHGGDNQKWRLVE